MKLLHVVLTLIVLQVTVSWTFTLPFFRMLGIEKEPEERKHKHGKVKKFKHGYITSAGPMVHMDNIPKYGYFGGGYFAF